MLKTLTLPAVQRKRPRLDRYLMRDPFGDALAAGAVNGTTPLIGNLGSRVVTDANSKLSIANGVLTFATGGVTEANPALYWSSMVRGLGMVIIGLLNNTAGGGSGGILGFDNATLGNIDNAIRFGAGGALRVGTNNTASIIVGAFSDSTNYNFAVVKRVSGMFYFIKGGTFTNWTFIYVDDRGTQTPLFPVVSAGGASAPFTADNIRIPARLFIPAPEASDGFSLANTTDGLGHAEANGGADKTWTGATWTVAAGAVSNTPTQGAELLTDGGLETWASATDLTSWTETIAGTSTVNREATVIHGGTYAARLDIDASNSAADIRQDVLSIGSWYSSSVWMRGSDTVPTARIDMGSTLGLVQSLTATYVQKIQTNRASVSATFQITRSSATSKSIYADDVSVKMLTLSTLFRSLQVSTPDVLAEVAITRTAGTQSGLVLNLDSAGTPANFIIVYMDGAGNCIVDECVAGVYTNKQTTAVTYSAGAVLRVVRSGTALRVFYNNLAVGVELTMTANTAAIHGLFDTYGNSFDNFVVYPRGTEGQWEMLGQL